jgi:hypothetical protein
VWAQSATPDIVPVDQEPMHKMVLDNEYVRVFLVEVPSHGSTMFHRHNRDYIFVTLGDTEVESERVNEKPLRLSLKDGEARFTKGGFAHRANNLSDKSFRNVTVEFKAPVKDTGRRLSECLGGCKETVVDGASVQCHRFTGVPNTTFSVKQPVLVVRTTSANTRELIGVSTEPGRDTLISFYGSPEGSILVRGSEVRTDFTACTFAPPSGTHAK